MRAEIDIRTDDGLREARRRLQAMRERSQNPGPAWNAVLNWLADQNKMQFRSDGLRWSRKRWTPLAESTRRDKRRSGYPRDILIRTGELRDELTRRPFGIERFDIHGVVAGTGLSYAAFHQRGTRYMPARKLVDARRVRDEGVAGRAVISWVVHGHPSTDRA